MSWSQLTDYNRDRFEHPDYSVHSFEQAAPDIEQNLSKAATNSVKADLNDELEAVLLEGMPDSVTSRLSHG